MDIGTLAGIGAALVALLVSMIMEGTSPAAIIKIPALLLVFGGTFGAAMAGGLMKDATAVIGYFKRALTGKAPDCSDVVTTMVAMADRARREGLLALEEMARDLEDPFVRRGIELTIDGTDPDELRDILEAEIEAKHKADRAGIKLFADMGGYAPTIGIIGTVVGLVHVLGNLSQPATLGEAIAGAFVATLWGVMSANLFWLPISNKLKRVSELEVARMELVVEGVLAVQSGTNPRLVERRLTALLPPSQGKKDDAEAEAA